MPHHHHPGPDEAFVGPEEVARVVADGEIALDFVAEVVGLLDHPVRRVLDIGSGPGVATLELARLLPEAEVVAIDASESMVDAVIERANLAGVGARVSARVAELPGGIGELDDIDLVWASMSLHHVSDERAAIHEITASLSEHGVLAIVEFGDQRRLLPPGDDALGDRVEAAYERYFAEQSQHWHGNTPSGELSEMVRGAGLEVMDDHVSVITHEPPLDEAQRRYVTLSMWRAIKQLDGLLDPADLTALELLAEDDKRPDGTVVVSRRILLARRASTRE
ncbi:class I SAM-dependent methyltransferase [Aeromicrobium sp.]|uniref:class I SAM-dependent methyltransferase n=1 Tax=Aeromicrobium sp. TaxID=1871063 RepID=UPI002FCA7AD6